MCRFKSPEQKINPIEFEPPRERAAWSGRQHDSWTETKVHLHQALPRGSWHRAVGHVRSTPLQGSRAATHAAWTTGWPIATSAVRLFCWKRRGGLGRLCGRILVRSASTLPRAAPSRTAPRRTGLCCQWSVTGTEYSRASALQAPTHAPPRTCPIPDRPGAGSPAKQMLSDSHCGSMTHVSAPSAR
jgi:hypothetical protein